MRAGAPRLGIPIEARGRYVRQTLICIFGNFIPNHLGAFNSWRRRYAIAMPSFDIVSQVNPMEIENAVNQAKKELATRFDFKGSKAEIVLEKSEIKLSAEDQFKMKALVEIVIGKLAKRNISLKNVDKGEPD